MSVVVPVSRPMRRAPASARWSSRPRTAASWSLSTQAVTGQRAGRAAVGDDGQALADQFGDDRVVVGGVDDDGAVEGDVRPDVVARGGGEDDEGVAAGERGGGGGSGHLGEVRELGEGERFIPVRRHGQADEARLAGTEGAGGGGRAVAQPVGDLADMAAGGVREPALAVERVGDGRDGDTGGGGHVPDARPARPAAPAGGLRPAHLVLPCCCHGEPIVGLVRGVGPVAYSLVDRHVSAWSIMRQLPWKAKGVEWCRWHVSRVERAWACRMVDVSKRSQLTFTRDARHGVSHRRARYGERSPAPSRVPGVSVGAGRRSGSQLRRAGILIR